MAKSVTVTFDDGTNHTYDNVPDEVTDDQVTSRAGQDFGDKTITGVVAGSAPASAPETTQNQNGPVSPNDTLETLAKGAKTIVTDPLGSAITAGSLVAQHPSIAAGAAGLYKANKMANTWMASKTAEMEAAKQIAQQRAASMAGHQNIQQQKINLKAGLPPSAPQGQQAFGQMANQLEQGTAGMNNMPGMGAGPAPAPVAQPPSSNNFMSRVTQLADQYLPAARTAARALGTAAAGYELGKGLFYTSPEEIATMKAAEAQRRAQGWKPLNER